MNTVLRELPRYILWALMHIIVSCILVVFTIPWWKPWIEKEFLAACSAYHERISREQPEDRFFFQPTEMGSPDPLLPRRGEEQGWRLNDPPPVPPP